MKTKQELSSPAADRIDRISEGLQFLRRLTASSEHLHSRLTLQAAITDACSALVRSAGLELNAVLGGIAEAVRADRAYLFRSQGVGGAFENMHEWCAPGITPRIDRLQAVDAAPLPWWTEQLCAGRVIAVPEVGQLPEAATRELELLEARDVHSLLLVPICFSDGALAGFIGFDQIQRPPEWTAEEGERLAVIGELLAAQWERASAEERARQREVQFRVLVQKLNDACTPQEAAREVLDAADRLLGWDAAWLFLCDPERGQLEPVLMYDELDGRRMQIEPTVRTMHPGGLTWRSHHEGAFLLNRTSEELAPEAPDLPTFGDSSRRSASIMCAPVLDGTLPIGTLSVQSYELNAYSEADLETLQTLADYCAGTLKRCQAITTQARLREERFRAETARRESEEALYFAMMAARLGVWDRDLRTELTTWTDYAQRLPNGEPLQVTMTSADFFATVHPEDRDRVAQLSARGIRENTEVVVEYRMNVPEIGERWMCSRGRPLRDASGQPLRLIGTAEDITERKRLELALRDQQGLLDAVLENVAEGVLAYDQGGTLTYSNRASRERFGARPLPLTFTDWSERFPCFHADGVTPMRPEEMPLVYALQGQVLRDVEMVIELAAGEQLRLLVGAHPMRDGSDQQVGVVATIRDITASRELEEQLRQSQKMEAIGRLAGGVAHDFNNLLAVMNGYTELILMRQDIPAEVKFCLQEVQKAGERAAGLTRQLLAFSRKDVVVAKMLDLGFTVSNMDRMLQRLIGEDVELTSITAEHPLVRADPGHMEQILLNLAVNARDAMPEGGRLTIRTEVVTLDRPFADLHPGEESRRYALLSVSDTGHGMDFQTQKRVFEPFFTTKPPGSGTGIGLSTVYAIVKQWGGHVEIDSAPARGATFKIYLPLADGLSPDKGGSAWRELVPGRETILLVEDDEMVCTLTRQVLEGAGYAVLVAPSPAEALRIASDRVGDLQLVLTDVVMPQMNGRELAQRLTARRPELRVMYMSGYTDDAVVRNGVLAAEAEFIQKPFSPAELTRRIRELLDRVRPERSRTSH